MLHATTLVRLHEEINQSTINTRNVQNAQQIKNSRKKMPNMYLKCKGTSARFLDKNERHIGEELFGKQHFLYFKIAHQSTWPVGSVGQSRTLIRQTMVFNNLHSTSKFAQHFCDPAGAQVGRDSPQHWAHGSAVSSCCFFHGQQPCYMMAGGLGPLRLACLTSSCPIQDHRV